MLFSNIVVNNVWFENLFGLTFWSEKDGLGFVSLEVNS